MKKVYFITGSQDLYGEECLLNVAKDSKVIAEYLDNKIENVKIEYIGIVRDEASCVDLCKKATNDNDCIAVITWMHTFSPAKMWIKGLQLLKKPLLHFHTQANEKLPYDAIDMDFMNLNQTSTGAGGNSRRDHPALRPGGRPAPWSQYEMLRCLPPDPGPGIS